MDCPEGAEALPNRDKALVVAELSGHGHAVRDLLEAAGLARSSYYYALAHPQQPTRVQLRPKVAQIFSRTPNGCGHRQVAMCLRAEEGVRIADKTVLKMMRQMGLRCGIRRERPYRRYNSYKGEVGQSFANIIGRNFTATGPWQKLGTDVTEFKLSFGKAYLAPVYDFASKEIVAHSISRCPNLVQQQEMLQVLMGAKPEGAKPILHSDMGWQYQHETYISTLADNGFIQSMSRKGNCIDNGATEQVFGHIKDEFFRGQDWQTFESFKADLDAYITHWNTVRRQVKLRGLTPVEYRVQALQEAA
ncbi:MAG: IS3 family transposase [Rothia mucilaginosa]|uniref:IS3 family transposase n=1 Tax=Rothia mucilaginosa TaxID=43675 RepID=A0A930L353_9MICC|nr:IS3 family transposase [Rothia mucilaginosa]